ncbi:MAG: response regulator [Anaerolineae bacterium]|jgi:CheY-like chemotaxis protein|nr:response regulator [Anaerolineae bacterium]
MTTVLLLEDNIDMLTMLAQVLAWGGYDVLTGRGGNEGITLLREAEELPSVIVSDLSMPDLDGYAVLHYVRTTPEWAEIPFVIMSAHSSPDDRRDALQRGADEFLVKPFNLDDFKRVLHRWD